SMAIRCARRRLSPFRRLWKPAGCIPRWSGSSSSSSVPARNRSTGKRPRSWGLRTRPDYVKFRGLIQGFPVTFDPDCQDDSGKQHDLPKLQNNFCKAVALEEDAADDPKEMGERQEFSDDLRPFGHAAEREHEPGEQQRREKEEKGHLHRLELVFCQGGKRDAHRQVCGDEYRSGQ